MPSWTPEQLQEEAQRATDLFIRKRLEEGTQVYGGFFEESANRLETLFKATEDLRSLAPGLVAGDTTWLREVRYLAGPPVSADDLRTIVSDRLGGRVLSSDLAARVVEAIHSVLDPYRFPWVAEERAPTAEERSTAVGWTAGLIAVERLRTHRRTVESREQELEVRASARDVLGRAGTYAAAASKWDGL